MSDPTPQTPPAPTGNLMTVFSVQTGQPIQIPHDQAADAFRSGQYTLPAGSEVPVTLEDGSKGTVPFEQLPGALDAGASIMSPEEHAKEIRHVRYGSPLQQAEAFGLGAARGATFGGSDVLARALGKEETVRNLKEENPWSSGLGEVAGTIAPALLTGGASEGVEGAGLLSRAATTVGRVAGAPVEGASLLGNAAEGLARRLLPEEATSLAGKLAQKTLTGAARQGVEGLAYTGGDLVSEQALSQDPELDGQKVLSALGHGALLGMGTGGLLSATGALSSDVLGRLAPRLRGQAEDQAIKWVGGSSVRKALDELPGGARAGGRELLNSGVMKMGDTFEGTASKLAGATQAAEDKLQGLQDSILTKTETPAASTAGKALFDAADDNPHIKTILTDLANPKSELSTMAASAPNVPTSSILKGVKVPDDVSTLGALRKAVLEAPSAEEVEDAAERASKAAKKLGGKIQDDYEAAKLQVQRLTILNDAAQKKIEAKAAQPGLGGLGLGGLAVAGSMLHHAVSGGLLGLPAVAASAAYHFASKRAGSSAAVLLDKLAALGGVNQAIESVDRQIARGAARITGDETVAKVRLHHLGALPMGYDEKRDAVMDAVTNAQDHVQTIQDAASPIAQHSPRVGQAFQRAALRSTMYLASQLPKPPPNPADALHPLAQHWEPAPTEKARFDRIFNAVHDPMSLLAKTEDGSITPEEVSAVGATHPDILRNMREEVKVSMSTLKTPLPYTKRLAVATLLGQPVDASMSPTFVQAMQQTGGKGGKGAGPAGGPKRKGGHSKATNLAIAGQTRLAGQPQI